MKKAIFFLIMLAVSSLSQGQAIRYTSPLDDTSGINGAKYITRNDRMMLSTQKDSINKASVQLANARMDSIGYAYQALFSARRSADSVGFAVSMRSLVDTGSFHAAIDVIEDHIDEKADQTTVDSLRGAIAGKQAALGYVPLKPSDTTGKWKSASYTAIQVETDPIWNAQKGGYLTTSAAASTYQPAGNYATPTQLAQKLNITDTTGKWLGAGTAYLKPSDTLGKWISKVFADITYKPMSYTPAWADVSGKPIFANVAFSGSYTDLINKPVLPAIVDLGTVTVSQTALAALNLGPRIVTITGVTGLLANDRILLTSTPDLPAGYLIGDASCAANGTMKVNVYGPALVLGASYSFTAKVTVFRF